jgi:acetyl esterase
MTGSLRHLPGRLRTLVSSRIGAGLLRLLPLGLVRRVAGTPPEPAHGLHPDAWLLALLTRTTPPSQTDAVPVAEQRRRLAIEAAAFESRERVPVTATDHVIAGPAGTIPARLLSPDGVPAPAPLLVYFHGGGWVQGSIATHEASCRLLAHLAGVRVLSVDYRLAPEHPFPAAVDDAVAAYAWAVREADRLGADPLRIAVGGDSAGGNLAAVVAQAGRDDDALLAPVFQLLIYPVTDESKDYASSATFADGYLLTAGAMDWYSDKYLPPGTDRSDPRISPLCAPDLTGLAPAHVATCLTDPLRDEGEAYAHRLRAAGVPVSLQRHGQLHGFFNTPALRSSRDSLAMVAGALRQGVGAG